MQDTQETWVLSLGQEDFLEEEMAIHSSILAGKIPWTEEPGGPQSIGLQKVGHLTFIICYLIFIIILKEMHLLLAFLYWWGNETQDVYILSRNSEQGNGGAGILTHAVWVKSILSITEVLLPVSLWGSQVLSVIIFSIGLVAYKQRMVVDTGIKSEVHHLLKRLSLSHCIFLPPLSKIRYPYVCGFISGLSILFHWCIFLSLCQYHTVLMTVAL